MNARDDLYQPPHSVDAEQSVLGGILITGATALDRIEGIINEKDFYRTEHRQIFSAINTLANSSRPIDAITVAEALEVAGSLSNVGGLAYIGGLAQNTPSAANIASYAKIVRERAQQRNLLALAEVIKADCAAPGADVTDIISRADAAMIQLLDGSTADEPTILADCMADAIADIDNRATGHHRSGLLTGIVDFDALTCGLEPGQLVIIAARPSVGKTAFALNIADNVTQQGEAVAFFSLEMTRRELAQRLIALRTSVSVSAMRSGQLNDGDQWSRISACQAGANGQQLFLIDRSAIGVPYVRAAARKIKRQNGLGLIVVDYLGLMRGEGQNRTQEIGSLSRGLKALAKELHVPIIALAQLNRGNENRQDKRPQLSDLRDSGEVEQDADIVAMLHAEASGLTDLLVRKNRNGALGTASLQFQGEHMRFSSYHGQTPRQTHIPTPRKGFE